LEQGPPHIAQAHAFEIFRVRSEKEREKSFEVRYGVKREGAVEGNLGQVH